MSSEGVTVDPAKIEAIKDWPLPQSVKALWGFLGLCGYYRKFVPKYSQLAAPLTELLRKDAFVWTPVTTQAFQQLQLPDFSIPLVIQMVASGTKIGAISFQKGHLIAYFSKQLGPRLQASSTYARKMFAITESIKKWQQHLLGRRFTVKIDHWSLRALLHQTIQTPE